MIDRVAWLVSRDQACEVVAHSAWPEADEIHGREAAWDFYVEIADTFEEHSVSAVDIVDAGADKVLVH